MAKTVDERITELEFQLAHQVKLTVELNGVVADQNRQLFKLQRTVQRITEEVKRLKQRPEPGETTSLEDEKPPHY